MSKRLSIRSLLSILLPAVASILFVFFTKADALVASAVFFFSILISLVWQLLLFKPYNQLVSFAGKLITEPSACGAFSERDDDIGQLVLAFKTQIERVSNNVERMSECADGMNHCADSLSLEIRKTEQGMMRQSSELNQISAEMQEVLRGVQEVGAEARKNTDTVLEGTDVVAEGKSKVSDSARLIQQLNDEISRASDIVAAVDQSSKEISGILNVIGEIADQTNLLALNAAIEAARAGEVGRGFSVVADEVRSLAARTRTSTEEIHQMIERLQSNVSNAVDAMETGQQRTRTCVEQSEQVAASLDLLADTIRTAHEINQRITGLIDKQSAGVESAIHHVDVANGLVIETTESTKRSLKVCEQLRQNGKSSADCVTDSDLEGREKSVGHSNA